MKHKEFSQLKENDNVFFLIDQYGILGNNITNTNYGLIIESRKVTYCYHRLPRTDNGTLINFKIKEPIVKVTKAMYIEHNYINGKQVPETIPERKETLFECGNITKKEGEESHIIRRYELYYNHYIGIHIFTTKEELKSFVKEKLEDIEENLKKIHQAVNNL